MGALQTAHATPEDADTLVGARRPPASAGMVRAGVYTTYVACFVTPWNGISIGPLRPGDLFTFLAVGILLAADLGRPFPRLPRWTSGFLAVILLVTALHVVLPTDSRFLSSRVVVDARGLLFVETQSNTFVGLKFFVGVLALAWMLSLAGRDAPGSLTRASLAFMLGAAVSSALAFADVALGTHLSVYSSSARASGLSVHPNFLAETAALGVPLALWLATRPRLLARVVALPAIGLLALGTYATGSRGGSVAFALAVLATLFVLPPLRRALPLLMLVLGFAATVAFLAFPSVGDALLKALRLTSSSSVTGSDFVRSLVLHQATLDFQHSPVYGVGMQVSAEAQNVYLQTLAAGGLLLFGAYVLYLVFAASAAVRLVPNADLARPLLVGVGVTGILGFVENALTDRLAYVVPALIAALWSVRHPARRDGEAEEHSNADGPTIAMFGTHPRLHAF